MCGIAGFLDLERPSGSQELEALGRAMAATLNHRGPDAHGLWADADAGVVLGHTRLSIVDLSPAGAQPMIDDKARIDQRQFGSQQQRPQLCRGGAALAPESGSEQ